MENRKIICGLALAALFLLVASTRAVEYGPTSLEVWSEIYSVRKTNGHVAIEIQHFMRNDPYNTAQILQIVNSIEARQRGNSWVTVATWVLHNGSVWNIPPNQTAATAVYTLSFEHMNRQYTAYRSVLSVLLGNHPTGERWFHYRLSFYVPMPSSGSNHQL